MLHGLTCAHTYLSHVLWPPPAVCPTGRIGARELSLRARPAPAMRHSGSWCGLWRCVGVRVVNDSLLPVLRFLFRSPRSCPVRSLTPLFFRICSMDPPALWIEHALRRPSSASTGPPRCPSYPSPSPFSSSLRAAAASDEELDQAEGNHLDDM